MDSEFSSFDTDNNHLPFSLFYDKTFISRNGATSECYKIRIYSKWHFLKRPKREFASNPIYLASFEKEFDLGFTLDHPNIVRYISKGNDSEGIYILTEYVDGLTLSEFRLRFPDFFKSETNIRKILLQLLSALEYLHNRQIVHLDIKPDNILITSNGQNLKLIDLGMSYSDSYCEITGGTKSFGSPEQFINRHLIDFRSDLFAFGKIVLFVFFGDTRQNLLSSLPVRYGKLTRKCLVEDIDKRNITAKECISKINHQRQLPLYLASSIFLLIAFLFTIWFFKSEPSQLRENSSVHQDLPVKLNTIKASKEQKAIESKAIKTITPIINIRLENVPDNSDCIIEEQIKEIVRNRLSQSISNLNSSFDNINSFNIDVLRKSFENWKKVCDNDCKFLYEDYKSQISFVKFQFLYNSELGKINSPIQKKLNEFSNERN